MITGIKYPFQFYSGRIATSTGEQHLKESILQLIGIQKGQYIFRPTIGSTLQSRVFDPVNTAPLCMVDIRDTIEKFETRVILDEIDVDLDEQDLGKSKIGIRFTPKGDSSPSEVSFDIGDLR